MKVTLINHTRSAAALLAFTKATRLSLTADLLEEIGAWPEERLLAELEYMAGTIPSSWEFVDYTFAVEGVSRAYTHQQVRTRAASYAQQTLRILDVGDFEYVYTEANRANPAAMEVIDAVLEKIKAGYRELIQMGQAVEDARGILPTNIATNIVCKFNLRTLSELARSRTGGRTQAEYRAVINAMLDCVLVVHPWAEKFLFPKGRNVFDDIESFARMTNLRSNDRAALLKLVDRLRKEV